MAAALHNSTWMGLNSKLTPSAVYKVMSHIHWTVCVPTKWNRHPTGQGSEVHSLLPGESTSTDYQGLISPTSVREFTGYFICKDLVSGYRHAVLVKDKIAETFLAATEQVSAVYQSHGNWVYFLRCDAGSNENAAVVTEHL